MRAIDTSVTMEVIAKPEEYGTVVPSNITSGPFVQLAADNNDLNEETLDGKNTTHATTMVVYQQKPFGPEPSTITVADHSVKCWSLQSTSKVYDIQECSAHGRRPAASAYISEVEAKWYKESKNCFEKASDRQNLVLDESEPHKPTRCNGACRSTENPRMERF